MPTDRDNPDDEPLAPEDVDSPPTTPMLSETRADPNDEVPVPIAMSPAEVDERAQVVEKLRGDEGIEPPAGA